ncbi:hypothetical protein HDU92_001031 [Lobulomyces angularis]|nr:hypothetical protein HDU92_001031 [Lobulomyces angularis]
MAITLVGNSLSQVSENLAPALKIDFYFPNPQVLTFNSTSGIETLSIEKQKEAAVKFMLKELDVGKGDWLDTGYLTGSHGIYSHHCSPLIDGIEVANARAQVNLDQYGNVFSMSSTWIEKQKVPTLKKRQEQPIINCPDALQAFASYKGLQISSDLTEEMVAFDKSILEGAGFTDAKITCSLKYFNSKEDGLIKVRDLSVPIGVDHFNVFVDAKGSLVGVTNWASSSLLSIPGVKYAENKKIEKRSETPKPLQRRSSKSKRAQSVTYRVIGTPDNDPRQGLKLVTDPADTTVSRLGWHNDGTGEQDTLAGNNAVAQANKENADDSVNFGQRPKDTNFNFDFPFDDSQVPSTYSDFSATNAFFITNLMHDVFYHYGFDEVSGNFQKNNFEKGGLGDDAIIVNVQDGSGVNNANFVTPPDGIPGKMRMFIFDDVAVGRDGALSNDIVIHELMHGVTSRLTGGPQNVNCLSNSEAGGLSEGWSDMMALTMLMSPINVREHDFEIGTYVTADNSGVRNFPYSTSLERNPDLYSDLKNPDNLQVHKAGEIFATMLYEVYWNLVDEKGFSPTLKDVNSGKGNTAFVQLLFDGLKIQPCNPTFMDARNAMLQAALLRDDGTYCAVAKGFAKRGLGVNATPEFDDDFTVPDECA